MVTVFTESEIGWLFIAAGVLVWLVRAPPAWLNKSGLSMAGATQLPLMDSLSGLADTSLLLQIAMFFAKAGAFVFGSWLAIVPLLYGGVVSEHHWLTERQFIDAAI